MGKILITGSGGLVGKSLVKAIEMDKGTFDGYHSLTTNINAARAQQNTFLWNIDNKKLDEKVLEGVSTIIHLAGASVAGKRWTRSYKNQIMDSRIKSAELIYEAVTRKGIRIEKFISASGIGFYQDPAKELLDESGENGHSFLAEVCLKWEQAAFQFESTGAEVTVLRIGPVLAKEGGMLPELSRLLPFRMMPVPGNPKGIISWIHLSDLTRIFIEAAKTSQFNGTYNAVAPNPVTYLELLKTIAGEKKCIYPTIPSFVLSLLLGERHQIAATDQKVSSQKLQSAGFEFLYPTIKAAIQSFQ